MDTIASGLGPPKSASAPRQTENEKLSTIAAEAEARTLHEKEEEARVKDWEDRKKLDERIYGIESAVQTGIPKMRVMMEDMMRSRIQTTTSIHVPVTESAPVKQPVSQDNSKGETGEREYSAAQ